MVSNWQQKRYGVSRISEKRDGLGKNETILRVPVDFLRHGFTHFQLGAEETLQRATSFSDVNIGDFVESHEDWSKQGVHQHADAQGDKEFAPAQTTGKPLGCFSVMWPS